MDPARKWPRHSHCFRFTIHSSSLLLLFTVLPTFLYAQRPNAASSTLELQSPVSTSKMSLSTPLTVARPPNSLTTSFTTSSVSNTTTATSTLATNDVPPALGIPPATGGSGRTNPERERRDSVFNYYFLFLAVFGVLVAGFLWWLHRRRKKRKEQMRLSGQNALARDLDGWINTRRWMHGRWRQNQTVAFVRREEGLDERGEAPPPYEPKSETTVNQTSTEEPQSTSSRVTIPLRTLSRDEIERVHPPDYLETETGRKEEAARPDTAATRTTRPDTAITQSGSSTRNFIQTDRPQSNS